MTRSKGVWCSLLSLLPPIPDSREAAEDGWMDGMCVTDSHRQAAILQVYINVYPIEGVDWLLLNNPVGGGTIYSRVAS